MKPSLCRCATASTISAVYSRASCQTRKLGVSVQALDPPHLPRRKQKQQWQAGDAAHSFNMEED